jgi:hypothetical protein
MRLNKKICSNAQKNIGNENYITFLNETYDKTKNNKNNNETRKSEANGPEVKNSTKLEVEHNGLQLAESKSMNSIDSSHELNQSSENSQNNSNHNINNIGKSSNYDINIKKDVALIKKETKKTKRALRKKKSKVNQLESVYLDGLYSKTMSGSTLSLNSAGKSYTNRNTATKRSFSLFKSNIRMASMIFLVTLVYYLSIIPWCLTINDIIKFNPFVYYSFVINSCVNPIIYGFFNDNFRNCSFEILYLFFRKFICCVKFNKREEMNNVTNINTKSEVK